MEKIEKEVQNQIIHLMDSQKDVVSKGGTMRLGSYPCHVKSGTKSYGAYASSEIAERHRHRFEFNNDYRDAFTKAGIVFSGVSPDKTLVEIMEIPDHPWFVACQFHPELKSRPMNAHPLFREFVKASLSHDKTGKK